GAHRALHSFPTRRSSDLACRPVPPLILGGITSWDAAGYPMWFARRQENVNGRVEVAPLRFGPGRSVVGEEVDMANRVESPAVARSEEHTSELQSRRDLVC